jgi:hypothetical protein
LAWNVCQVCEQNICLGFRITNTIELRWSVEARKVGGVVLMRFHMRKDPPDGQVRAVHHDILKDIRVSALGWDAMGGKVLHYIQSTKAVQIWTEPVR